MTKQTPTTSWQVFLAITMLYLVVSASVIVGLIITYQ